MGAVMKVFIKVIFLIMITCSFVYSQTAPNFTLKDRNNNSIKLSDFKSKVLILIFTNTKNKLAIVKAKELKRIFDEEKVNIVIITTNKDLSPIDFNTFVGKNSLEKSGIYALKGDNWVLKAYSVKDGQTSIFILKKLGNKFFILKRFNNLDNIKEIKLVVESALSR